jgi:hypothetical protein
MDTSNGCTRGQALRPRGKPRGTGEAQDQKAVGEEDSRSTISTLLASYEGPGSAPREVGGGNGADKPISVSLSTLSNN